MAEEISPTTYLHDTLALKHNIEAGFLLLGERLYKIKRDEMWKGNFDSYQDFLFEMKLSEGTDSKLRTIYTRFVLEYKLPAEKLIALGWSSLYEIAAKVQDKEMALAIIEKAAHMKRDDIAQEIRSATIGEHTCSGEERTYLHCGQCKKMTRIK